ncbi:unnamed protein product [Hermetia illucens]|uniref:Protein YIF1 n=1 Tax=Hermetia illucens TaxID=343691 RepID=A0A7R8YSK9_HERIL|nr:protein YIF1B isoform X2 [Hermetia illucens]CAD7083946.1 unnamed protein product [Hermetia illucens]
MNFNANAGVRHPQGGPTRKPKRVSDVNAMGLTAPVSQFVPDAPYDAGAPAMQPSYVASGFNGAPAPGPQTYSGFPGGQQPMPGPQPPNQFSSYPGSGPGMAPQSQGMPPGPPGGPGGIPPQFAMFQQPIVQDMAMQYGQRLADQGKQLVENQFEKWVPVTRLKYYFAVDNKYVVNKMRLLFFPFIHKDWSLKYDHDNPVQPRYDINAPDLYIPTMAYITYVVVAGLVLGMQNRFSPEQLGYQASSALACSIFELIVYSITLYVTNIPTTLKTLDLLAYSSYKYATIVFCILVSILFKKSGYYTALIYCSLSLGFFLLRTLKAKVLHDPAQSTTPVGAPSYDPYGMPQQQADYSIGRKRKLYFLFLVAGSQAVLSFWLSMHLIPVEKSIPNFPST